MRMLLVRRGGLLTCLVSRESDLSMMEGAAVRMRAMAADRCMPGGRVYWNASCRHRDGCTAKRVSGHPTGCRNQALRYWRPGLQRQNTSERKLHRGSHINCIVRHTSAPQHVIGVAADQLHDGGGHPGGIIMPRQCQILR